jgi:predicted MFS family arabinose efflux permease
MIKIPSYKAAIIFGAIGMPAFVYILKFLENESGTQIAQIVWSIIGFGLPFLISTGDLSYIRREMRKGRPFFGPWTKFQGFKEFYLPAWKRMSVWFLAACVSLLLLNLIGMDLN